MLKLEIRQMAQLQQTREAAFVEEQLPALQAYAPVLARTAGAQGLRQAALAGVQVARGHGLSDNPSARLYLELMLSFGSGFGTDPQYRWLQPFLVGLPPLRTAERVRLLHWHSTAYLHRAYGRLGLHGIAAAERGLRLNEATLASVGKDLPGLGPQLLARLHPQRMDHLDAQTGRELLAQAEQQARQLQLAAPVGPALMLLLMFAFGHEVARDPLYPWVDQALRTAGQDGEARNQALWQATRAFLDTLLAEVRARRPARA